MPVRLHTSVITVCREVGAVKMKSAPSLSTISKHLRVLKSHFYPTRFLALHHIRINVQLTNNI